MDPDAALRELIEAFQVNNRGVIVDKATDLMRWLDRGGSLPTANREITGYALRLLCAFLING